MATTLTATITSKIIANLRITSDLSSTFTGSPTLAFARSFTSTEISKCYFHSYSVTSTPTSVDLTALTDIYGAALSFSTVRHLLVINHDLAIALTVGGGTNGLFAALPFTLAGYNATNGDDGSCLNLTTNITVDGTHKILTLTAASGTIAADVFIVGA